MGAAQSNVHASLEEGTKVESNRVVQFYSAKEVEQAISMNQCAITSWKNAAEELWEQNALLDRMLRRVEKDLSEANQMLSEQRKGCTELRQENERIRLKMSQQEYIVRQMERLRFLFGDEVIEEQLELEESIREQHSPHTMGTATKPPPPTTSSRFHEALNELESRADSAELSAKKLLGMFTASSQRSVGDKDPKSAVRRDCFDVADKENIKE